MSSSYSSQSYSSYSYSTSDGNGPPQQQSFAETTSTDNSGTTVHRVSKDPGQEAVRESFHVSPGGKVQDKLQNQQPRGRIEEATDADETYEERMEDEYAKREGGA
jgi:hypothetical protein